MISAIIKVESQLYPVNYYNFSECELILTEINATELDSNIILDYKNNTLSVLNYIIQQPGYVQSSHVLDPIESNYGYFFSVWGSLDDFNNLLNSSNIDVVNLYKQHRNIFLNRFGFSVSKIGIFNTVPTNVTEIDTLISNNDFSPYPVYSPFLD